MTDRRPVVLATTHELLSAATGRPITVTTLDGDEVLLRLPTADELRTQHETARQALAAYGLTPPTSATDEQLAAAVRPLEIPR